MANITVKNFGIKKYQLSLLFFSFLFFIAIFSASYIQESNRNDLLRIDNIQTRAESGEAQAQYELALRYHSGKNYLKAHEWYLKAAEQGHAEAQNNLGTLYSSGLGVQDYPKAIDWMRKAADAGNANAQANMGVMYLHGRGVEKSDTEAFKWFLMAAEQGQAQAEAEMGRAYHLGLGGFPVDDTQSFKWYKRAAEKGDGTAQNNLAHLYIAGKGIEKNYFEAGKWLMEASQRGIPQAQNYLAYARNFCSKESKDEKPDRAYACVIDAQTGNPDAQNAVGYFYHRGVFLEKNTQEAAKWYTKAAKQGQLMSQSMLSKLYYDGDGVPKDLVEAYAWASVVAANKDQSSEFVKLAIPLKQALQQHLKNQNEERKGEDKADEYRRLYLRD